MTSTWPRTLTGLAAVLALAAGCSAGTTAPPAQPVAPAPSVASAPPVAPAPSVASKPAPASPGSVVPAQPVSAGWRTGPVTVGRTPAVPPIPVVTRVRYAAHPGFDRVVFDIDGALPGYSARYVSEVRADGSGELVAVPGRRFLLVVLTPAYAHRDGGTATVNGVHLTGLPNLRSYAVVGDYEGYVSIALGLDDVAGFRIGELPGRIYLDIAA